MNKITVIDEMIWWNPKRIGNEKSRNRLGRGTHQILGLVEQFLLLFVIGLIIKPVSGEDFWKRTSTQVYIWVAKIAAFIFSVICATITSFYFLKWWNSLGKKKEKKGCLENGVDEGTQTDAEADDSAAIPPSVPLEPPSTVPQSPRPEIVFPVRYGRTPLPPPSIHKEKKGKLRRILHI